MASRQTQGSRQEAAIPCPSCGKPATGRFCTECGAVVREMRCASCGVSLTPGAKFCHDCGAPAGAQVTQRTVTNRPQQAAVSPRTNLPWMLVGFAAVTLAVIFAAQRAGQVTAPVPGPMATGGGGAASVDISSMTPQERASRLFDRIMRLSEEGKRDSVELFSSMAIPVYESLGPLDLDARYDFGRIAQVSGKLDIAQAQADTILQQSPSHLLGLILAASVAEARGKSAQRITLERRLLDAEKSQLALGLDEYKRHEADITAALAAARGRR
jgi:double zinc ribbon protein